MVLGAAAGQAERGAWCTCSSVLLLRAALRRLLGMRMRQKLSSVSCGGWKLLAAEFGDRLVELFAIC